VFGSSNLLSSNDLLEEPEKPSANDSPYDKEDYKVKLKRYKDERAKRFPIQHQQDLIKNGTVEYKAQKLEEEKNG